tara:strand:- start:1507 stop:1653 length:147 start_codon:yes stop_codon:yes gene_type:complete
MKEAGKRVKQMRTDHFFEAEADTMMISFPLCIRKFNDRIGAKHQNKQK